MVTVPKSAHDGDKILGFSKKRINNWKNTLEDWEIALVEFICSKNMNTLGYKKINNNLNESNKLIQIAINKIKKNKFVLKNYNNFKKEGIGSNLYPMDPTDPRSWGQRSNPSKWFIESEDGKNYLQELAISSKSIMQKYL